MASRHPDTVNTSTSAGGVAQRETAAVRSYLEALRSARPKRGRQRTVESVQRRLDEIESQGPSADVIAELKVVQERLGLISELTALRTAVDISAVEAQFISVAKSYSVRTGVSYAAWRTVGVPAATLKAAGIGG